MSFVLGVVIIVLILALTTIVLAIVNRKTGHGKIVVSKDYESGKKIISLELDLDPDEIETLKRISFEVVKMEEDFAI